MTTERNQHEDYIRCEMNDFGMANRQTGNLSTKSY